MKFLSNLAPKLFLTFGSEDNGLGTRLGRQAQIPVLPEFEAIDPSIRPVAAGPHDAEVPLIFPKAKSKGGDLKDAETVAGHWAY
ncbi:MAG: hypothetical protein R3245_00175 [Kiloniellales bacterium]|nr:hypothetical protein [Kiloniellales bacterium]